LEREAVNKDISRSSSSSSKALVGVVYGLIYPARFLVDSLED
jgi:hypothetical protein